MAAYSGFTVLLFEWVLIFEKLVASVSMGTYICGVLVFDAPENTVCTCISLHSSLYIDIS